MKKIAKIWHYFICAKLQPTTNVSAVMKSRAALVYAILEGMKIDVVWLFNTLLFMALNKAFKGFCICI